MVLRHTTGDVSVMMLDSNFALDARGESHSAADVAGMQIVRSNLWRDLEEMLHPGERFFKKEHGFVVFKVADVLAEDRETAFGEAKGVLQFAAKGQDFPHVDSEINCLGHK